MTSICRGLLFVSGQRAQRLKDSLTTEDAAGAPFYAFREISTGVLVPKFSVTSAVLTSSTDCTPKLRKSKSIQSNTIKLRANQVAGATAALMKLSTHSGITLRADCGTGKTVMALFLASKIGAKGVLILTDQIDIAEQWASAIREFLPKASYQILGGGHKKIAAIDKSLQDDFTIVVAQSLWRQEWAEEPIDASILIVDEAHVFSAPCFFKSLTNINFNLSIALTATPDRKDGLEWVFAETLGKELVEVVAHAMTSQVHQISVELPTITHTDFYMRYCKQHHGMTWKAKCIQCDHWAGFPFACGGLLPLDNGVPAEVVWGDKLNRTSLMKTVAENDDYLAWLSGVISGLYLKGRNILVLGEFKDPLKYLLATFQKEHGNGAGGLFIGKSATSAKAKHDRTQQLLKPVTFCTYGVAAKALDVPHKDTPVLSTPRSDIRQAKGRIERVVKNKATPIIIDPVHVNIHPLRAMARKRRRIYEKAGCEVIRS
jgi:hypothetical protein